MGTKPLVLAEQNLKRLTKLEDATKEQVIDEYIRIVQEQIYETYLEYHEINAFKEGFNTVEPSPYKPETKQAEAWAKGDECAKEVSSVEKELRAFLLSDVKDLQALLLSLAEQRTEGQSPSDREGAATEPATDVSEDNLGREAAE